MHWRLQTGTLTGKGLAFGGSLVRTEATGYGAVYFMENMLNHAGDGVAAALARVPRHDHCLDLVDPALHGDGLEDGDEGFEHVVECGQTIV